MATIRWTVYDNEGNEIESIQLATIDQIESVVEAFGQQALPQVNKVREPLKKSQLVSNGT